MVRVRLEVTLDETDGVDDPLGELSSIPFKKEVMLCFGEKLVANCSTSNSRETIVLFEKVLELLEKNQHDRTI